MLELTPCLNSLLAHFVISSPCYSRTTGWKRILFAEAPRNAINIFTLYTLYDNTAKIRAAVNVESGTVLQFLGSLLLAASTSIFIVSFLTTMLALIIYIPLMLEIQGNLKEYCCHKIDKR